MQLKITTNAKAVALDLSKTSKQAQKNIEAIVKRSARRIHTEAQVYPTAPSGSTYRRTGDLRRGWRVGPYESGSITIRNNTSYGPYVQMQGRQAGVHKGRWQTDEDLVKAELKQLQAELEAGILDGI